MEVFLKLLSFRQPAENNKTYAQAKSYTVVLLCLFVICINPLLGFINFWLSYQLYGITSLLALIVLATSRMGYHRAARWGILLSFWSIVIVMALTAPETFTNQHIFLVGIALSFLIFDKRETASLATGGGVSVLLWLLFTFNPYVVPLFPEKDYYQVAYIVNILCTLLAVLICLYYLINNYESSLSKLQVLILSLQEKEGIINQRNRELEQAIEELSRSRDELLHSQDFLTTIIDNLPVMLFVKEAESLRFTRLNKAGEKLVALTEKQLIGKNEYNFLQEDQARDLVNLDREILLTGESVASDETITIGKESKTLRLKKVPIYSREGEPLYLLGIAEDITMQKQIQDQMQASLYEKEILLSEIHHRVKNNMAIVSSLLALQANHLADSEAKALFMESCKRIKSMALIHEKLYQSQTLAYIEYRSYVNDLVNNIKHSYSLSGTSIQIDLEGVEPLHMDITAAVPCGLILNELISNAYKHAFVGRESGTIKVDFAKTEADVYELTVSDNGTGMDPKLDIANANTLGMILIDALVSQLKGKIEIAHTKGTSVHISFREPQKKATRPQYQV
jgi:PAS domain S-box-containing protein